jgi:hypothetical protein
MRPDEILISSLSFIWTAGWLINEVAGEEVFVPEQLRLRLLWNAQYPLHLMSFSSFP